MPDAKIAGMAKDGSQDTNLKQLMILLVIPASLIAGYAIRAWIAPKFPAGLGMMGGFLIFFIYVIATRNREFHKAGMKPQRAGFSAQLDLVKEKLRERASEWERALTFDRKIDPLSEEVVTYIIGVLEIETPEDPKYSKILEALHKDGKLLESWSGSYRLPESARDLNAVEVEELERAITADTGRPIRSSVEKDIDRYIQLLRSTAASLETRALEVREKGSIYRYSPLQFVGCLGLILLFLCGGGYLLWRFSVAGHWASWVGWGLLVFGVLMGLILFKMQTEPA